ncbi:potassium channel family protein [Flavobacteriaceae bacterium 3-367]|uniref:ion channel n=1 Tax=Eudoraea algarum TaxID=3417568 RepID=UPI00327A8E73
MKLKNLYLHRFEFFLITQAFILFGSLFVPYDFHENILLPILFLLNTCAGILLISKKKKLMWFLILLILASLVVFGSSMITRTTEGNLLARMSIYFVFYIIVTWNIVQQVWGAQYVNKNVIMGLMSGYIALGFLAFFLFLSIELVAPGSFEGVLMSQHDFDLRADSIMYYAYITLLTIGYGEIIPVTSIAQKAAILVGLLGQFYMVIITAVVVEKYIRHSTKDKT